MKYYSREITENGTFSERVGEPEEFDASIGKVLSSFAYIEQGLENLISIFLGTENEIADIVTSELSFKGLLNLSSSLFIFRIGRGDYCCTEGAAEQFRELITLCQNCEDLRNKIVHSAYLRGKYRIKKTAKVKHGLKVIVEPINQHQLLDISDHFCYVAHSLEEFPVSVNIADDFFSNGNLIEYKADGKVIFTRNYDIPEDT